MSLQDSASYSEMQTKRKAKRIFHRMITGLQIAHNGQREMRFLTLTTSKNRVTIKTGKRKGEIRTPKDSFDILRQRIKRATVSKDGFQGFNLNKYYCLRTKEGHGVLHIIFWGGLYIPIQWLKRTWELIHGAYEVNIQYVHNLKSNTNRLVGYLLDRYLMAQPIERMSYGWGWAWLGFCKSWINIKYTQNLLWKTSTQIFRGLPSFHRYFSTITHFQFRDKWWHKEYSYQALPTWKCTLWEHPITSRQTKFFYNNRGFNKNYF